MTQSREHSLWTEVVRLRAEVVRLMTEIERRREKYPYSEVDMDMHVEAVTKDLKAEIARLRAEKESILETAASWADRAYNNGAEAERLHVALKRICDDDTDDDLRGRADILSGIAYAALYIHERGGSDG